MDNNQRAIKTGSRPAKRKLTASGVMLTIEIGLVAIGGILFYFPLPWKMWGAILLCVVLGSQMVWRFFDIITPSYAGKLLPYIVATFLALVPVYAFGHGLYQLVAIIVFAAIIGITGFYWFVWAVVSSFQEVFLGKKH